MKVKTSLGLAMAAGLACSALANEPITTTPTRVDKFVGHVYINLATGEYSITYSGGRSGAPVWSNTNLCAGTWSWNDWTGPTTQEAIDWGSIDNDTVIDGYQFAYSTNLPDLQWSGIPGFDSINYFYDDYLGFGSTGTVAAAFQVGPLPGASDVPVWGWWVTVDLAGGNEFTLSGDDVRCGDGLHEFGWGCAYNIPMTGYMTGPILTAPDHLGMCGTTAACSTGNATGVEDAYDLYLAYPQTSYDSTYYFGGFDPPTQTPAGSFWMELYSGGQPDCPPDWNGDTVLNSLDFIAFLNDFVTGNADYNGDTITNSLDFIAFLNDFVVGC
jgi:hypothetical protein